MQRMTVWAAGAAAVVVLGIGVGWMLTSRDAPNGPEAKAADRELTTGTIAARTAAAQPQPAPAQASQPQAFPAAPSSPQPKVAAAPRCDKPDALGVFRTVAIDTAGGPGFGSEQFKAYDF